MPVSKAQQKAVNKYMSANYDRINLTVAKGQRDTIKAHAEAQGESTNAFIGRAIQETMERDEKWMNDGAFFEWMKTASPEDMNVFERVSQFEGLFQDMTFSDGTPSHEFVKCQMNTIGTDEWVDDTIPLPDEIEDFSYTFFTYYVKDLSGSDGRFNLKDRSLSIDPAYINDDPVILHEMIHLHEFVIDKLPLFYHDALLFCLYRDLKSKIADLDERIEYHGHILNSQQIAIQGDTHDILFLLKSFDLDLKMGYKLWTVFGYGMADEYKCYESTQEATGAALGCGVVSSPTH